MYGVSSQSAIENHLPILLKVTSYDSNASEILYESFKLVLQHPQLALRLELPNSTHIAVGRHLESEF